VTDGVQTYEDAVLAADDAAAIAVVEEMLHAGAEPVSLITNVIAAAQRANGIRWQRGECTVAEEHAATAMAVASTKVVLKHVRRTPVTRGPVLVACAEREWHALPAMMVHVALRADGWDSTLLGASTSPMRLSQHLQDIGPDAVAVSCSMLGAMPTTRRFIEATTAAGVPVIVGGAAFGVDVLRAEALGATAWARDARGAVAAMHDLPMVVSPAAPLAAERAGEQAALELDHRDLVEALRQRWSPIARASAWGEQTAPSALDAAEDVLNQILHAVSAALLTGDPRPVPDTFTWIGELMQGRGVDVAQVHELGQLLVDTLRDYPQARALVEQHYESGLTAY
jgi:methanogenic corrinoid protein MtbC1